MSEGFKKILAGHEKFRLRYGTGPGHLMEDLALQGQKPEAMVVACSDSRVDPALLLQTSPGDLFVVRNVANIVPPYESDEFHHGTSAALEFGICYLQVKHLIILGHSQCGGIHAMHNETQLLQNDFIGNWMNLIKPQMQGEDDDACAKSALQISYQNCLTFPWIRSRLQENNLSIHLWFFDIQDAAIHAFDFETKTFKPLL